MKTSELNKLLGTVSMRDPHSAGAVDGLLAEFIAKVGPIPHEDYLDFMREHNGCDGPVGRVGYISIWSLEDVISGTEGYHASEFAPGLLLFGSDGGNEAYAFDRQAPGWPIVSVPLIGMSREEMIFVASTFSEFVRRLADDELPI